MDGILALPVDIHELNIGLRACYSGHVSGGLCGFYPPLAAGEAVSVPTTVFP